jgi:FkbM family methyltransferase
MTRYTCLSRLRFGDCNFLLESVLDPWGEDDPLVADCLAGKFDENTSLSYWLYLVSREESDALFVDVGAYAGIYSLLAAKKRPSCKVLALEAASVTYGRLVRNVVLNSVETTVCAAHFAAWEEATTLDFTHRYGIYSMCPGDSAIHGAEIDHTESVFSIALDQLLNSRREFPGAIGSRSLGIKTYDRLAAIKIDVEGAELNVLRGAVGILKHQKPTIICEVLSPEAQAAVTDFVAQFGYVVEPLGGERNVMLVPAEQVQSLIKGFKDWRSQQKAELTLTAQRKWMHLLD